MTDELKKTVEEIRKTMDFEINFSDRCPYTDKPCEDWNCSECEVNAEELKWLEEGDD